MAAHRSNPERKVSNHKTATFECLDKAHSDSESQVIQDNDSVAIIMKYH